MALIVEDGSIVAGAESYATIAFADQWHANRGNDAWDSVDAKDVALRKATDYMVGRYRDKWAGVRKTITQTLDWPRDLVPVTDGPNNFTVYYLNSIVPLGVQIACVSLALRSTTEDLVSDLVQGKLSVSIGPITTVYDKFSSRQNEYPEIDRLLRPYLRNSGGLRMIRI